MEEILTVNVTEEDIHHGIPGTISECPIAKAIVRENPAISGVQVGGVTALIWEDNLTAGRYLLPAEARAFIIRFDSSKTVEPFEFILREWDGDDDEFMEMHEEMG